MTSTQLSTQLTEGEARSRVIEPSQFVADTDAFIDVRLPRSIGKASYSFIGPGVSQNVDQSINIQEPHGFNLGAASMASGGVNNQHLHFTAEVLICTRGRWRITIGENSEQSLEIGPGDIFSAPTWAFRGFENLGDDDGWLFVALGGDDTGGILWAPQVLKLAGETGLYLGADYSIRDALKGDNINDVIKPLTAEALSWVRNFTDEQLCAHRIKKADLAWSSRALLTHSTAGHACALAPVIGHGMSQDRSHVPHLANPHGFSLEWLQIAPGNATGTHRHSDTQAIILVEGSWEIDFNLPECLEQVHPVSGSVVSVPRHVWRNFRNIGSSDASAVVINGGDSRTLLEFVPELARAAFHDGWELDAAGYVAPVGLSGR